MSEWWEYDQLESGAPYDWGDAHRGDNQYDNLDFHIDLGAGTVPKGRLTIDRHGPVDIEMDLNTLELYRFKDEIRPDQWLRPIAANPEWVRKFFYLNLPFPNDSIESIISHHCLEHIGDGFIRLMDECHRILKPGGIFRIIVPLFPSISAVEDQDHKRYFCKDSFEGFCGTKDGAHWHESFSVPYTKCRFKMVDHDYTPPKDFMLNEHKVFSTLSIDDLFAQPRELRVALKKQ